MDIYGSCLLARLIKNELDRAGVESVIAPPFYWGVNHATGAFVGSFKTRPEVAEALLTDVTNSLADDGFRTIYIVNHHGDGQHGRMLLRVLDSLREEGRVRARWLADAATIERLAQWSNEDCWLPYEVPREAESLAPNPELGVHADDVETAFMMRWYPELVHNDRLRDLKTEPASPSQDDLKEWRRGGEHAVRVTPHGYFGNPRPSDPELWRLYEYRAAGMADAVIQRHGRESENRQE